MLIEGFKNNKLRKKFLLSLESKVSSSNQHFAHFVHFVFEYLFCQPDYSHLKNLDFNNMRNRLVNDSYGSFINSISDIDNNANEFLDLAVNYILTSKQRNSYVLPDKFFIEMNNTDALERLLNCSARKKKYIEYYLVSIYFVAFLLALSVIHKLVEKDLKGLKNKIEDTIESICTFQNNFDGQSLITANYEHLEVYSSLLSFVLNESPLSLSKANSGLQKIGYNTIVPKFFKKYNAELTAKTLNFLLVCNNYKAETIRKRHSK